jgi:hypothetical protein
MHHPDGILWIAQPGVAPMTVARKVSLREIAPTIVALCDIKVPGHFALPPMPEVIHPPAQTEVLPSNIEQMPTPDITRKEA